MVALATTESKRVPSRMNMRWLEVLLCRYTWLTDWMSAIGTLATSADAHGPWLHAGRRFGEAVTAQRLAESYNQKGERVSAVGVLADAAAQFSEGRFPSTSVDLLRRIVNDACNASSLRTVAETCLNHGEPKHLVAAVCLLGIAYEHDRTDTRALELLARTFARMGLEEKARKVEAVLAEMAEEEPTSPVAADRPLSQ